MRFTSYILSQIANRNDPHNWRIFVSTSLHQDKIQEENTEPRMEPIHQRNSELQWTI